MILVDTSIWIDHLRAKSDDLSTLLEESRIYTHPFILGELSCGHLKNRATTLSLLAALPMLRVARNDEVLHLIESRKLMGKGIGYVDAHLLTSLILTPGANLWSGDVRLQSAALDLKVASKKKLH
ncbi:VapC toxin family PIN domain ribonuclease [Polynucleobacter sp. JS-Safj-400b-B2]|uniref:type II toxin-antitoxin system VapC family toxin n=1 Tax=Polynucleobacter sp. JS-Safj-400b-B2 TaxID=2576921 RepID=UPI001C0DB313|nr:VapC toxin family PIN domain ribonuclease [Polynucleobacter sp. JS-Safj-400b-B2]